MYLGLSIYARRRKRELVDAFFKLGVSVSYDRILSISTDIGNTICRKHAIASKLEILRTA